MILLFIGASGSGKDTQAEILAGKYGYRIVATGEVFREIINQKSDLAAELRSYIDAGKLVPDTLVYQVLGNYLQQADLHKLIFSGAVRTVEQVPMMDEMLEKLGAKLDRVILFELADEEAIRRLGGRRNCPEHGGNYHVEFKPPHMPGKCDICGKDLIQRDDDKPEAIKNRLAWFRQETDAILAEYNQRGILTVIDASPSIVDVAAKVQSTLNLT